MIKNDKTCFQKIRFQISPTSVCVFGIWVLRDFKKSADPQKDNISWILTDEQDLLFHLIGFTVFPRLEKALNAVCNAAQKAMTEHNNEFCEWTCLYAPLPRGWNMISREWKPFENFILERNTERAHRGQQRDDMKRRLERRTMKPRVFFRLYLSPDSSRAF